MIPDYVEAAVAEFGRSAGLSALAFNGRGAAALRFANGFALRFEYAMDALTVAMTVPCGECDEATARSLLGYAKPPVRDGAPTIRSGFLSRSGEAIFAIAIQERDVTSPAINAAFAVLWQIATEFGGPR